MRYSRVVTSHGGWVFALSGVAYDENGLKLTAHGLRAAGASIADENGASPTDL
ncbi:hypothetical protein GCM10009664_71770 [Kitasatospora gansuensis]